MSVPRPFWTPSVLCAAFVLGLALGCGGPSVAADAPGASVALPPSAPEDIRSLAAACDQGQIEACNRIGVWLWVGGAGEQRRADGLIYLRHACRQQYAPACQLLDDLDGDGRRPAGSAARAPRRPETPAAPAP